MMQIRIESCIQKVVYIIATEYDGFDFHSIHEFA
jgi:hypothetical protein